MSIKQKFIQELINEDVHLSLTNEQRESIAELHEYQLRLHVVSNSLDLVELERKIDEALDSETSESLKKWLHSKRL